MKITITICFRVVGVSDVIHLHFRVNGSRSLSVADAFGPVNWIIKCIFVGALHPSNPPTTAAAATGLMDILPGVRASGFLYVTQIHRLFCSWAIRRVDVGPITLNVNDKTELRPGVDTTRTSELIALELPVSEDASVTLRMLSKGHTRIYKQIRRDSIKEPPPTLCQIVPRDIIMWWSSRVVWLILHTLISS